MRSTYKQAVSKETQSLQGAQIFQEKDEQTSETSTSGLGALPEAQRQTWHVCGTVPGKYKLTVTASVVPSTRFFVKIGKVYRSRCFHDFATDSCKTWQIH